MHSSNTSAVLPLLAFILALSLVSDASAWEQEALFGTEEVSFAFSGGPALKISTIAGENAWFMGLQAAMTVNHHFNVGFGAYGLATDVAASDEAHRLYPGRSLEIEMAYGGMEFGISFKPEKLVHVNAGVLLGAGNTGFRDESSADPDEDFDRIDTFFIAEPSLGAALNVTSWLRAEADLSYRAVSDLKVAGIGNGDVSGLAFGMFLNFGSF